MNWRRIYTSFYYIWMSIQHIVSAKSTEKKQKQLYHFVKMVPALKSTIENCKKLFPQKKKNQFPVKISCHMVMNNKLLLKSSKDHIKKSHPKRKWEVQEIGMLFHGAFLLTMHLQESYSIRCLQDLSRATGNVENLLDLLQADKPIKFEWIKRRIRAMWPRWQAAFSSLKKKRNLSNTVQKKVVAPVNVCVFVCHGKPAKSWNLSISFSRPG